MIFNSFFSSKQGLNIFLILIGIFFLIFNSPNIYFIIKIISLLLIAFPLIDLVLETNRRYKINHSFKKNDFDSDEEKKVARYFKRKNIIYQLHYELNLSKYSYCFKVPLVEFYIILNMPFFKQKLSLDFYLPEFDVFVEYWGLIKKSEYKKNSYDRKTKLLKSNGIEFISLYPQNLDNLDFVFTTKLLDLLKARQGNLRKNKYFKY